MSVLPPLLFSRLGRGGTGALSPRMVLVSYKQINPNRVSRRHPGVDDVSVLTPLNVDGSATNWVGVTDVKILTKLITTGTLLLKFNSRKHTSVIAELGKC